MEYTGVPIYPYDRMTAWETLVDNNQVKKKRLIRVTISEVLLAIGLSFRLCLDAVWSPCGFDLVKKCWLELPVSTGHMYEHNSRRGPYDRQGMHTGVIDLDLRELIGKS